jgi:hypothetical protein
LRIGNRWVLPDAHVIMKDFYPCDFIKLFRGEAVSGVVSRQVNCMMLCKVID